MNFVEYSIFNACFIIIEKLMSTSVFRTIVFRQDCPNSISKKMFKKKVLESAPLPNKLFGNI